MCGGEAEPPGPFVCILPSGWYRCSVPARLVASYSELSLHLHLRRLLLTPCGPNPEASCRVHALNPRECAVPRGLSGHERDGHSPAIPRRQHEGDRFCRRPAVVYSCRFIALLGVSGSLVGSILCFFKGCVYIATAFLEYFTSRGKPMSVIIEAIDVYLIGTVMLVFGMGIYELFISNLDMAKISSQRSNFLGLFTLQERPRWLDIKSVNELKTKLGHVIVMVLLVGLFDKVQKVGIATPIDLLCLTASILLSSGGLFLLSKLSHPRHK
ncbi:unnamed protein product [Spirodela intermedia]|uniref:Uncharacterized protein n=1 Tax=Spirodela intermedia TaxID=51605 RepID=A0A7I8JAU9_SPIIN|nr:unnamed protein product [Spirodela intermedia]CAA6667101.1 unnamed protein product [Spirodela intermedia]